MLSEILASAFRKSAYTDVTDWKNSTKCPLATETVSKVIHRGKEPSIPTFIVMAYYLGMTPTEIAMSCKESKEEIYCPVFSKLIMPLDLDVDDKNAIGAIKKLSAEKKKLALELIDQLGK